MRLLIAQMAIMTVLIQCGQANAQYFVNPNVVNQPIAPALAPSIPRGGWQPANPFPNLVRLDNYAGQLAQVTRQLHRDAHRLSPNCVRTAAITLYADQANRLQRNLQRILQEAVQAGVQNELVIQNIRRDFRQIEIWLERLNRELHERGFDGAGVDDLRLMANMRVILARELDPLLQIINLELSRGRFRRPGRWIGRPIYRSGVSPYYSPIFNQVGYLAQP